MKIKPYVDKLEKSKEYSDFSKKHPDAYLVAGFFVLDLEGKHNVHQIDFYIPSLKKIGAFTLDHGVTLQMMNPVVASKTPEELDLKTNIDLEALPGILKDEMRNRSMSEDIKKIIAVIQTIEGKRIWNLNCVLTGMELLKSHIEDSSESVLKIEKLSMMDLVKKMPMETLKNMQQAQQQGAAPKKDVAGELKKLDALAVEIEREKKALQKTSAAGQKQSSTLKKKSK